MFASKPATNRCLRAFFVATAVLMGSTGLTFAEDVGLTFAGNINGTGVGAARFHFKVSTTSVTFPTLGADVYTYCISPSQFLNGTDLYKIRDDIQNLPTPGSAMGAIAAVKIAMIINEIYGSGSADTSLDFGAFNYIQIQDAIWYLIDSATGANNAIVTKVNAIFTTYTTLANYYASSAAGTSIQYIHGLDSYGTGGSNAGQDQIYWDANPNFVFDVPVPAGAILAGVGIFCVGGFNYLRRRNAKLA